MSNPENRPPQTPDELEITFEGQGPGETSRIASQFESVQKPPQITPLSGKIKEKLRQAGVEVTED